MTAPTLTEAIAVLQGAATYYSCHHEDALAEQAASAAQALRSHPPAPAEGAFTDPATREIAGAVACPGCGSTKTVVMTGIHCKSCECDHFGYSASQPLASYRSPAEGAPQRTRDFPAVIAAGKQAKDDLSFYKEMMAQAAERAPAEAVAQLLAQMRELAEETRQNPGKAVKVPPLVEAEGRKFMRGEPSLIDRLPLGDIEALGSTFPAPSQGARVGLTAERIGEIFKRTCRAQPGSAAIDFARAIESAHGIPTAGDGRATNTGESK
jgi:hypothetical protein